MWKYIRWFLVVFPIGFIGILTSWLFFIFAWGWYKTIKKFNPFWFWLDDTRITPTGYASDYQIELDNRNLTKENFAVAYYWHVSRNRMHNVKELFRMPNSNIYDSEGRLIGNNNIEIIECKIDRLHKFDGTILKQDGNWAVMAALKFIGKPGQDPWQVNKGDYLNKETCVLGTGFIIYRVGKWVGWRYSQCKIVEYKIFKWTIWKGYRTIAIGSNTNRYSDKFKHQAIKPWK